MLSLPQTKRRTESTCTIYEDSQRSSMLIKLPSITSQVLPTPPPFPPQYLGPNSFDNVPIEIRQRIAFFVEYDKDLCSFRTICRSTYDAVDADNCSFWRRRFLEQFDSPTTPMNNAEYRKAYQERRYYLKNGAAFQNGTTEREDKCVRKLMEILLGRFCLSSSGKNPLS
jgi:hypothetical protein